jgi:DNA-binding SARP family transcriptional activator/tetratricopeptide (TPR) repeat protein
MEFRLFGEIQLQAGGKSLDLGTPRQQTVLAALAVDAGKPVRIETLVDRVWDDDPPVEARNVLYSHLSRIRQLLKRASAVTGKPARLARRHAGYVLEIDPDLVDLHRFTHLVEQGGDPQRTNADRAAALIEALSLWRGPPLAGLPGAWAAQVRSGWHRRRVDAVVASGAARLALGQPSVVISTLPDLIAEYPLAEPLEGLLMRALHAVGRDAEAIDRYGALRQRLADELGADPGAELRSLHAAVLRGELPAPDQAAQASPLATPAQLPPDVFAFTGRGEQLRRLDAIVSGHLAGLDRRTPAVPDTPSDGWQEAPMVVISAIGGTGGIGKTWLALRWAHRNLHRFPDGQLFVDLHGFSPIEQPAHPVDVLGGFLDALGVDRDRQPIEPDRRADLYRSLVADKRMLIVLDNAATTDQVTPLLPGGRHCTVLITSRNHLHGLIARHSAHPIHLDVLTDTEAHTLLTTTLGPDHAATNAPAITELIELCGGLPLALGLIAARATTNPHLPLQDTVAELRALGLDALDSEDPTASLPTVLSWSLHHLTKQQRQVFALLGIAPGPDTGLPSATHLTGLPERETHTILRALADTSLINRTPGSRWKMHDLVRAYATTTANNLPDDMRDTALRRVLDFYTHTAHAADRLLNPHHDFARLDPPTPDVHPHPLPDAPAALAWFDTEHACLLAAQHTATTHHWHSTVWHLAWSLDTFHYRRGHRRDRLTMWQTATEATTHLTDPTPRTLAHRYLGYAHIYLGHHEDALDHLHQALTLAEHHHNPTHQALTHHTLASAWAQRGDDRQALDHARHALDLYRGLDQPAREANALNTVGWYAARLGDYDTARKHCQAALALHRHHHDPSGEASTLDSLGYIDHHSGHHTQAINHYHHALTLLRDLGNIYKVATTLDQLGHPHAALGQTEQARTTWREALRLYQEQGRHDDAAHVQHQLHNLDHDNRRGAGGR